MDMFKHVQLDLSIQGPPTHGHIQTCSVGPLHTGTPTHGHVQTCSVGPTIQGAPPMDMFKHVQLDLSIQGPPTHGHIQTCSVGPLNTGTPYPWTCSNMFNWTSPYRDPLPMDMFKHVQLDLSIQGPPSNMFSWTSKQGSATQTCSRKFSWTSPYRELPIHGHVQKVTMQPGVA